MTAYPSMRNYYYDSKRERLLEQYIESMEAIDVIDMEENEEPPACQYTGVEQDTGMEQQGIEEGEEEGIEKVWPVEATLSIEKIDLMLPVLSGATKEHLNVSAASIENTGKPWQGNNYAVAGHRSRAFGSHFNRVNELKIGDEIVVTDSEKNRYIYEVFSKQIVDAKEISVLEDTGVSQITLITCDPPYVKNPPTRLVVKGKQIN